jgi:hypothetical protein
MYQLLTKEVIYVVGRQLWLVLVVGRQLWLVLVVGR